MIGQRYFSLFVLRYEREGSKRRVVCLCDCGKECVREARNLRFGNIKSCGCLRYGPSVPVGSVFGALTVISESHKGNRYLSVRCECGTVYDEEARILRSGSKTSCGCRFMSRQPRTHGDSRAVDNRSVAPEYCSWSSMITRCENPKSYGYKYYGARGITVCSRWHDYSLFLADMGRKPTPEHQIERIDNDSSYRPENCRWATRTEQNFNKRNTVRLTVGATTKAVAEWAHLLGIRPNSIYSRLKRDGLHGVEALLGRGVTLSDQLEASIELAIKGRKVA